VPRVLPVRGYCSFALWYWSSGTGSSQVVGVLCPARGGGPRAWPGGSWTCPRRRRAKRLLHAVEDWTHHVVERYARAWHPADIPTLVALLRHVAHTAYATHSILVRRPRCRRRLPAATIRQPVGPQLRLWRHRSQPPAL